MVASEANQTGICTECDIVRESGYQVYCSDNKGGRLITVVVSGEIPLSHQVAVIGTVQCPFREQRNRSLNPQLAVLKYVDFYFG